MASSINALTSSGGGVVTTADASGVLNLQSNGTTVAAISSTGVAVTGDVSATGSISATGQIATLKSLSPQTTTSGTSVDFTIPSWAKRIIVMMNQVSISAGNIQVQLGTSSGIATTGYLGGSGEFQNGNTTSVGAKTSGFNTESGNGNIVGIWTICNFSGNTWTAVWNWNNTGSQSGVGGAYIALSGTLTTVRVLAGTGTFSAGSVNVMYE